MGNALAKWMPAARMRFQCFEWVIAREPNASTKTRQVTPR